MKPIRPVIRFLVAAVTTAMFACEAILAQDVRVEVSLRSVVSDKVPRIFGYSGNIWWIPPVFDAGVAEKILSMRELGITRISLGDQVLGAAGSLDDLRRRLEHYPLNDFLRRYVSAGGKVLFILDGVPRWVSSNKSTQNLKDPTQPIFRMSPPANFEEWSKVVEVIVRHFNGRLGLNAYYESWNEPNWYYLGTTEQYLKQYYHSVLGARRADPKALIGGPSISEFLGVSTRKLQQLTESERMHFTKQLLDQQYLFKQFLDYAGRTSVPELGLKRLPVDFFSWHSFYVDPTNYYELVVPAIREALAAAGYPRTMPLINTEWNIAAVPPYPEGDLNATEVGAAFVATSLIAMHEQGVYGQIFQMYVDPGTEGYHGGTFTRTGIPRANFNAFRLFSLVKGQQLRTRTTDPWVKSVAFSDGSRVYLLLTTFLPTSKMTIDTFRIRSALANAQFLKSLVDAQLVGAVIHKQGLPEPFASKASEIAERDKKAVQFIMQKAAAWKNGLTVEIELSGSPRPPGKVTRYLIDSSHSNIYNDLAKAEKFLIEQQRQRSGNVNEKLRIRLQETGISNESVERLRTELRNKKPIEEALATVPLEKREAVRRAIRETLLESRQQYKEILGEIENWRSARLHQETMTWPSSGSLRIRAEPYSVQLLILER